MGGTSNASVARGRGTQDIHRRKPQKGACPALSGALEGGTPGRQPICGGGGLGCVPWWAQPGEDRMGPGQPLATPAHLRGAPGSSLRLRAFVSKRTGLVASSLMPFDPQGLRGRPCLTAPCSSVSPAAAPLWAVGGFLLRQGWRRVRCHPPLCHAGALRQGRHGGGSLCDQAG